MKFPEEGYKGSSEDDDMVFRSTVQISDQFFKAFLDTKATLSILASRLLTPTTMEKTKTVAIGVADGFPLPTWDGCDSMSWL